MAKTLTAATAVIVLSVPGLVPPLQIQGFAADDVTDNQAIASAEVLMGVDGVMSAGFVFVPVVQGYSLQADSDSNSFFDDWWAGNQQAQDVFFGSAVIRIPAIRKVWNMSRGVLSSYKPGPDVKKILQPRKYEVTWGKYLPSNMA